MPELIELTVRQLRERGGKKWHTYSDDVLPAWVADMDYHPAEAVRRAVSRVAALGDFAYPVDAEHSAVAAAFASRMKDRFGWAVECDRVAVIADLVQGLTAMVLAYSDPGDGVLVLTPIYPPFVKAVQCSGRTVIPVPLVNDPDGFRIDFDLIEQHAGRRDVNVLLLCNPHNPTGRVFTLAELARLQEIATRHGLVVVADEIHADLVYAPNRHTVFADISADAAARTVTLQSATKAFNIGGLRCAVLHFGSEGLQQRFTEAFPYRLLGRVSGVSAAATVAAWRDGDDWLSRVHARLRANRDRVVDWVSAHDRDVRAHVPEATYFAWLDFSALAPGVGSAQKYFLESARVALQAGEDFDPQCTTWARLNFATSGDILDHILSRMSAAITRFGDRAGATQFTRPTIHLDPAAGKEMP